MSDSVFIVSLDCQTIMPLCLKQDLQQSKIKRLESSMEAACHACSLLIDFIALLCMANSSREVLYALCMGAGRVTWQYINEKQESTAGQHEINTQTLVHILRHRNYCH